MGDCNTPIMGKERVAMKGTGARVGWIEFAKLAVPGQRDRYYYTRCDVQRMADDVLAADRAGLDFDLSITHHVSDAPGFRNAMARIAHLRFSSLKYCPNGRRLAQGAKDEEMNMYARNCARRIVDVLPEYRAEEEANVRKMINEDYLHVYGLEFKAAFEKFLEEFRRGA